MKMVTKRKQSTNYWYFIRHVVIPTFFVFGVPVFGFILALFPLPGGVSGNFKWSMLIGDKFSWSVVACLTTWAVVSLKIPSKKFYGPTTTFGCTPVYSANGFQYFCATLAAFVTANIVSPGISEAIYDHMPHLLGTLNIVALVFCFYLWFSGRNRKDDPVLRTRMPFIFEFYRGMELHPRVFDMDAKQLINSRIGLMMWQLLTINFLVTSYHRYGFNSGILVNVAIQFAYLLKFYYWETGYFTVLDVTIDRPGFYISWGHLNFVPSFYTFSTYYLVQYPSVTSDALNYTFLILGLLCVYLNYDVDRQKELFILTKGNCVIWGEKAKCIEGYHNSRRLKLLISGYWGIARHSNYVFELLLALFYNLPCYGLGFWPFMYNVYLVVLLIHRIYRDEDKCKSKYGLLWKTYVGKVPYRLIPKLY